MKCLNQPHLFPGALLHLLYEHVCCELHKNIGIYLGGNQSHPHVVPPTPLMFAAYAGGQRAKEHNFHREESGTLDMCSQFHVDWDVQRKCAWIHACAQIHTSGYFCA